jgi:aquaporin Z
MSRLNHHAQPLRPLPWGESLRRHYPEYLMEAGALGLFMVSAGCCTVALEAPGSALLQAIPSGFLRRALIGVAMGLTAMALIYSPWGRRSGAHMNPAVTLSFLRLGKIPPHDCVFYLLSQVLGGVAGVVATALVLGSRFTHPPIDYIVTVPGPAGILPAGLAEGLIALMMMGMILVVSNHPRVAHLTGLFSGLFIIAFVTWESPYSGFGMNPARTLASSLPSGIWTAVWIYLTAPVAGMLLAAEIHLRFAPPGVGTGPSRDQR